MTLRFPVSGARGIWFSGAIPCLSVPVFCLCQVRATGNIPSILFSPTPQRQASLITSYPVMKINGKLIFLFIFRALSKF
jgi:hypothetical protein